MDELGMTGSGALLERDREMAADSQREAEAEDWGEALVGAEDREDAARLTGICRPASASNNKPVPLG